MRRWAFDEVLSIDHFGVYCDSLPIAKLGALRASAIRFCLHAVYQGRPRIQGGESIGTITFSFPYGIVRLTMVPTYTGNHGQTARKSTLQLAGLQGRESLTTRPYRWSF